MKNVLENNIKTNKGQFNIKNQKRQPNTGSSPPQHEKAQAATINVHQKLDNACQDELIVQLEKLKMQQD